MSLLARKIVADDASRALSHIDNWEREQSRALYVLVYDAAMAFANQNLLYFEGKSLKSFIAETVQRWASVFAPAKAKEFADELRKILADIVQKGFDLPSTVQSLIVSKASVLRMARTAAHTASERGSFIAAASVGLPMMKEWASLEDDRVRPTHAAANGQLQQIHRPFTVGASSMMFPGDPTAPIGERANCRCTALYYPIINGEIVR